MTIIGKSKAALTMICDAIQSQNMDLEFYLVNNMDIKDEFHFNGFKITEVKEPNDIIYILGGVTPGTKKILYELFPLNYSSLINSNSFISKYCKIGKGSMIDAHVSVSGGAIIGKFVTLYSNCTLSHDSVIGDFSTICPGVVLSGNVKIGEGTFVGSNSVIKPDIKIGNNCTIGTGSVVMRDILDGETVYGNPARPK